MRCEIFTLGQLAMLRYGKSSKKIQTDNGNVPIYGTGGLMGYSAKALYDKPSVLIGRKGSISKVRYVSCPFWVVDTMFYTEVNNDIVMTKYLYYLMLTLDLGKYDEGTTIPSLRAEALNGLEFRIPPLDVQEKITAILSPLDDKIELNRRINANLEQQAQAVFDSWFINFDPFGGVMPDDWKYITLGDVTTNLRERVKENNYPVFSAVSSGDLVLSDDFFSKRVYSKNLSSYIIVNENNFAYNPARINIGSIGINDFDYKGCVSPVYVVIQVHEGYEGFFYFYFKSRRFKAESCLRASGSVRQTLNYSDFSLIEIIYPSREYAEKFNQIYKTFSKAKKAYNNEIQTLSQIHDPLLPKLISGEIEP